MEYSITDRYDGVVLELLANSELPSFRASPKQLEVLIPHQILDEIVRSTSRYKELVAASKFALAHVEGDAKIALTAALIHAGESI